MVKIDSDDNQKISLIHFNKQKDQNTMEKFTLSLAENKTEYILRHVTNIVEMFAVALLFIVYILIMAWHMQIFRRVFRLRGLKCIINPLKLLTVHLIILLYLIAKIITCAYALIAGRIDYVNKKDGKLETRYYNIGVYSLMLSVCVFTQMASQVLNIRNWLQIMNRLDERPVYKILIKIATPLIVVTLIAQMMFNLSVYFSEGSVIKKFSIGTNILNLLFIQFLTVSSCYIHRFFKDGYSRGQYLIRAIKYLNLGLQLKFLWILICIANPGWIGYLKKYNPNTLSDETPSWAFVWTFDQIIFSVVPTVALIFLTRPLLYITDLSGIQSVYKSFLSPTLQKQPIDSMSMSSQTKSFSKDDVKYMSLSSNGKNFLPNTMDDFQSNDLSGFFEPLKR